MIGKFEKKNFCLYFLFCIWQFICFHLVYFLTSCSMQVSYYFESVVILYSKIEHIKQLVLRILLEIPTNLLSVSMYT